VEIRSVDEKANQFKTGTRNHLILSRSQWRVIDAKTGDLPPGQPATALRASMVSARSCACWSAQRLACKAKTGGSKIG
jgi:hypothetical protein